LSDAPIASRGTERTDPTRTGPQNKPLPPPVSGAALAGRLQQIKQEMWTNGSARYYKDVEKDLRERELRLRGDRPSDDPPPTHD
jgi:hypothetical protein